MKKQILSIITCLTLCLGLLPVNVLATTTAEVKWGTSADDLTYSGTLAEAVAEKAAYIQLQKDIIYHEWLYINNSVTLDLNGYGLTAGEGDSRVAVYIIGNLAVTDSSEAKSGSLSGTGKGGNSLGVYVNGSITVDGVSLSGTAEGASGIGVMVTDSITVKNDGTLTGTAEGADGVNVEGNITVEGDGKLIGTTRSADYSGVYVRGSIAVTGVGSSLTGTGAYNGVHASSGIIVKDDGTLTGTGVIAVSIGNEANSSYKKQSETKDDTTGLITIVLVKKEVYTVTWSNGDGGSYEQKVAVGATITVPTSDIFKETVRKGGYEITGWRSNELNYTVGDPMPEKDLTFTAEYTATLTGTVTISGTVEVGETLTATVTDTNNTGELSYQWYRFINSNIADSEISGATSSTYKLQNDDIGRRIYCVVTSNIQFGSIESDKTSYVPALTFAEGDISISDYYGTYDGQYHGIVANIPDGADLYYVGNTPYDGKYKDAGTYNVEYVVSHRYYEEVPGNAVIQIDKAFLDVTADTLYAEVGDARPTPTYTITGFVNDETADTAGITGTPTLTYSETPDMSKTGTYFINVDTSGMSATNYDFNKVHGILIVLEHVHDFTGYTADGDTIYGTCSKDDCPSHGTVKLLTIAAPANAVYEQGLYHNASLFGYDPQVELDSESVIYTKNGVETDPVDAGTYTASYTYEGKTASVTYTVAKRPLTIKADHKTVYVGDSAPEYTYTVSGWSSNHDEEDEFAHKVSGVTAVCEDANLNRAGSYTITISGTPAVLDHYGNDVSANYELTTQNGTLTVSKRSSGGSGYVASYTITAEDTINGTMNVDRTRASSGTTVTLTVAPATGYTLETLTVTTSSGKEIELTNLGDGRYTFKMPGSKVTARATFMDDNTMLNFFVDVSADAYYHDAVLWAAMAGITGGTSSATFSPNDPCTRAQMATFLWRAAGSPEPVSRTCIFIDVPADAYYAKAVQWAYEQELTAGTGESTYSPDEPCIRAQMVTFLWRNAGSQTPVSNVSQFADVTADTYYATAVQWAYEQKITAGTGESTFSPNDPCTRAQMVTFLYRFFVR